MPIEIDSNIEIANPTFPRGQFRFAVFDFDGTLSLIREGWMGVMIPYFVEELMEAPRHEAREVVDAVVRDFVETLTGKQTIYQCFRLAEEMEKRGGTPRDPLEYKHEYLARLWERIEHRVAGLKSEEIDPDEMLLRGSRAFLQALQDRGVTLYLASGTDLKYVEDEARALKVDHFFNPHIYAALDRYQDFSKKMIIERLLAENSLSGPELLVVGDGYVEIENGKTVGGFALGVASDEAIPGGLDEWKRKRLLSADADAIIRDYDGIEPLLEFLFP